MFERFTERSRQVVVLAQEEARNAHHKEITTSHILMGLLREEHGLAARVLEGLGITKDFVSHEMQGWRYLTDEDPGITGQVPFTHPAKKSLELALREALALGHNYIGTEHILLGLVRDGHDALDILAKQGVTAEDIRNEVVRMLQGPPKVDDLKALTQQFKLETEHVFGKPEKPEIDMDKIELHLKIAQMSIDEVRKELNAS